MGASHDIVRSAIATFFKQEGIGANASAVEKGRAFTKWAVETLLPDVESEVLDSLLTGGPDDEIDALVVDSGTIYVIQGKYGSAHKWAALSSFKDAIPRWKKGIKTAKSQRVKELIERIAENEIAENGKMLRAIYVTDNVLTAAQKTKIEAWAGERPELEVWDLEKLATPQTQAIPKQISDKTFKLKVSAKAGHIKYDSSVVVAMPLASLATLVKESERLGLFASNIRNYSGPTTFNLKKNDGLPTVHQGIASTILEQPEMFWYFNNGITIVCEAFQLKSGTLTLTGPQVVNGCQTSRVVRNIARDRSPKRLHGDVLVRIIQRPDIIDFITMYTNRQNAVKGKHLFALDDVQRHLHNLFSKMNYFYEIQEKEWANLDDSIRSKYRGREEWRYLWSPPQAWIRAIDALQAYTSLAKGPGVAYAGGTTSLEPGDITFPADPHPNLLLFPFLVAQYGKAHWDYGGNTKRGEDPLRTRYRKAKWLFTNLTWRLLVKSKELTSDYRDVSPNSLQATLDDRPLMEALMAGAHEIVQRFYQDSTVKETLKTRTNTNLLTSGLSEKKFSEILEDKVQDFLSGEAWKKIQTSVKPAGPAKQKVVTKKATSKKARKP